LCDGVLTALFDELGLVVLLHGAMYVSFAALEQPQSIRSVGLHQTVGPCNDTTTVHTLVGQVGLHLCALNVNLICMCIL